VTSTTQPSLGLALSTVGRPTLDELLASVRASTTHPVAVAIADHTPAGDLRVTGQYPFPVLVVPSRGGASEGRNDAVRALGRRCDVIGFPNDDNTFPAQTLERVLDAFRSTVAPAAVACSLLEGGRPRFRLPPDGTTLDRASVWRAIEPAMFLRRDVFERVGGFREDLGTGASSPWQSGDGTDLLLRVMQRGGVVLSRPGLVVYGRGERKGLSADALVAKHRAYARGTGYVYRSHPYPSAVRARVLIAPLVKAARHDPSLRLSLRLALARTTGRFEGLRGRPLARSRTPSWP
jgi:GT2 family glycosyltransferase